MGMGEQYTIYQLKPFMEGITSELLPQTLCYYVIPIKPLQWWQQAHCQRVKQAGTGARFKVFFVELLVPLIREAEIQEQPSLSVFEEYLVAADFVDAAVECQPYHRFSPIAAISLTQWRLGGKEGEE